MAGLPDVRRDASLVDAADEMLPRFGNRIIFKAETHSGVDEWTALEYLRRTRLAAYRMRAAGLQAKDPVLLWSASTPELVSTLVGTWRLCVIPVPLDQRFNATIAQRVAERSGAKWVITDQQIPEDTLPGVGRLNVNELVDPSTESLPADWDEQVKALPRPDRQDLLAVMYTSGTTGQPRGVMLTHGNVLVPTEISFKKLQTRLMMRLVFGREFRVIATMPMSHVFGMSGVYATLLYGVQIAFPRSRTPRALLQAMRDYRATSLNGAPRILEIVWRQFMHELDAAGMREEFDQKRRRAAGRPYWMRRRMFKREMALLGGALTTVGSGAAYLPPDLQLAWESLGLPVTQGYGATEAGGIAGTTMFKHPVGKVGKLMKDIANVELAADGEILVAGPGVSPGYWRDDEATRELWDAQGRYHTGDIGQLDRDGTLTLIGRKRNIIVLSNGLNVYPEDIEAALRDAGLGDTVVVETRPGRIEAVILDTQRQLPADPMNVMSPEERRAAQAARIDAAVRAANAKLTAHERVDGWRLWPEPDFPRTHTEKIRRDPVREWAVSGDVPLQVRDGLAEA
jgi:long-chain acyl-CoA synthetase